MSRTAWIRIVIALVIAFAVLLLIRQHDPSGALLALYSSFPA
jgi:hypothetical protein